jgi:spoIIIJ-associated protein
VEIVQHPSKGFLGLFKKPAVIVANCTAKKAPAAAQPQAAERPEKAETAPAEVPVFREPEPVMTPEETEMAPRGNGTVETRVDEHFYEEKQPSGEIAEEVKAEINALFETICFDLDLVEVSVYDEETLLVEFSGKDAALLIGKEGYRYKALSYMLFNWINSRYQMQLRLEIAEFLKNQEESIRRYLVGVCENIDRDGRAQTKILDGVLVQIALRELRSRYPDKYVAIRSTRDGSKFIIVNDYNEY